MIVGNGMIAKDFSPYETAKDILIFASGVSNSLETDPAQYQREADLLTRIRLENPEKLLVYFSSCSIFDPDRAGTAYVEHKNNIEKQLALWSMPFLTLRLPVVIGKTNLANTLPYFLYARIMSGECFDVWTHAIRYPIDIDDVLKISQTLIAAPTMHNQCINIALRPYPVLEIVHEMENITGRSANINKVDRGDFYEIERQLAISLAEQTGVYHGKDYLHRVLNKYFSN